MASHFTNPDPLNYLEQRTVVTKQRPERGLTSSVPASWQLPGYPLEGGISTVFYGSHYCPEYVSSWISSLTFLELMAHMFFTSSGILVDLATSFEISSHDFYLYINTLKIHWIWGSHSCDYEEFFCLLAYNAVWPGESQPMFRRNVLPPFSGSKNEPGLFVAYSMPVYCLAYP
jgi:hypothetical protein